MLFTGNKLCLLSSGHVAVWRPQYSRNGKNIQE
jgi:hypothetical protein